MIGTLQGQPELFKEQVGARMAAKEDWKADPNWKAGSGWNVGGKKQPRKQHLGRQNLLLRRVKTGGEQRAMLMISRRVHCGILREM